jgi:hypothetical protein
LWQAAMSDHLLTLIIVCSALLLATITVIIAIAAV